MTVVKFPYSASRRLFARRPRSSENGTPEERAMLAALTIDKPRVPRRSKNGTPEERAAKRASATVLQLPSQAAAAQTQSAADPPMTLCECVTAYDTLNPRQQAAVGRFIEQLKKVDAPA
jgi:hypothetical protein